MINNQNITVTSIQSVMRVKKNNPIGKIDFYTRKGGLETHELIFRLRGNVETHFEGTTLCNKKLTLQYLPKGKGDREYIVKTIEPGECIDIFFDTNVPLSDNAFCAEVHSPAAMGNLFEQISEVWQKKDTGYYCECMAVLYKILAKLKVSENKLLDNPHYLKIKDGVDYLNSNFCDSVTDFEYVASLCNMSYSYFRRLFAKCLGSSPAKYVIHKKIEYAKELLESRHYTVSEAANAVGFNDVYYFSHAFKNSTGCSPSAYKSKTAMRS